MNTLYKNMHFAVPGTVFSLLILLYILTLSPSVNFNDSGELITVAHTYGIAHPTGYPFFTALGRIASIFFPGDPAYRINLLSALFAALCGALISLAALRIFRVKGKNEPVVHAVLAVLSGLAAGTSLTLWQHATNTEVYSITAFFYSSVFAVTLYWLTQEAKTSVMRNRLFLFCAYLCGMAFTNHMSAIHIIPAVIVLLLLERKRMNYSKNIFIASGILFILGASWYLQLPIRAVHVPYMNWGAPANWHNFITHVSGWQYQVWMFSQSMDEVLSNLSLFFGLFRDQYSFIILLFAVLGIIWMFFRLRNFAIFLSVIIVSNVGYTINYSIPDIE
ncbi:DUF2723 domain-containing protein, partial [candidate division KSB1 bacterium]